MKKVATIIFILHCITGLYGQVSPFSIGVSDIDNIFLGTNMGDLKCSYTSIEADGGCSWCWEMPMFESRVPDTTVENIPPVINCINGLSASLAQSGTIQLWASDILLAVSDNETPAFQIKLAIQETGGSGFPMDAIGNPIANLTFDCSEIGTKTIELWAMDLAGNQAFCETTFTVLDNFGFCAPFDTIQVCVTNGCTGLPMAGVDINLDGQLPPFQFEPGSSTGANGCKSVYLRAGTNSYVIAPDIGTGYLNGLSTFDLLLLKKHLEGLEPLGNPYLQIAADADKSGSVSTFDLLEFKNILLGLYEELPNNLPWRFVDAAFEFPDPMNPFLSAFPEFVLLEDGSFVDASFVAVKMGDLDCSFLPQDTAITDHPDLFLGLPDTNLLAGNVYDLPVSMTETVGLEGYQFVLDFDPDQMAFQSMTVHTATHSSDWNIGSAAAGSLSTSWVRDGNPVIFSPHRPFAILRIKALVSGPLKEFISLKPENLHPEAYAGWRANKNDLQLVFVDPMLLPHAENMRVYQDSIVGQSKTLVNPVFTDRNLNAIKPLEIGQPYPNPMSEMAMLPVHLPTAENLQLEILDLSGKVLWFNSLKLNAGAHTLEIPATAMPAHGIYLWRVVAGDQIKSGKLIRM